MGAQLGCCGDEEQPEGIQQQNTEPGSYQDHRRREVVSTNYSHQYKESESAVEEDATPEASPQPPSPPSSEPQPPSPPSPEPELSPVISEKDLSDDFTDPGWETVTGGTTFLNNSMVNEYIKTSTHEFNTTPQRVPTPEPPVQPPPMSISSAPPIPEDEVQSDPEPESETEPEPEPDDFSDLELEQLQKQDSDDERDSIICAPYQSEQEMLDDEKIETLINTELSEDAAKVLGDPKTYDLPEAEDQAFFRFDRDLRKVKVALRKMTVAEDRKYAKLILLKHYKILNDIYRRYCKIGGDIHWLTEFGWSSMMADCKLITNEEEEELFKQMFHDLYSYHHYHHHNKRNAAASKHSIQLSEVYGDVKFFDKDPWTGIWMLQKDKDRLKTRDLMDGHREEKKRKDSLRAPGLRSAKTVGFASVSVRNLSKMQSLPTQRMHSRNRSRSTKSVNARPKTARSRSPATQQYFETYKLRKIGDLRISGCKDDINHTEIGGTFKENNYKKAKMEVKFKKKRSNQSRRIWNCTIHPPKTMVDPITMKVKWTDKQEHASSARTGTLKLFKYGPLPDDDVDLPIAKYHGLSRHEFFDAILCTAKLCAMWRRKRAQERLEDDYIGTDDGSNIDDDDDDDLDDIDIDSVDTDPTAEKPLYAVTDRLIRVHLQDYIYKHMLEIRNWIRGKHIEDSIREMLEPHNDHLVKLFKKYQSMEHVQGDEHITQDEWHAMALDLCAEAKRSERGLWKHGGKPTEKEILYCFTLCKNNNAVQNIEISFTEFKRGLIYFAAYIFKYEPQATYDIRPFPERMELVLQSIDKVDTKTKRGAAGAVEARTLKRVKTMANLKKTKKKKTPKGGKLPGFGSPTPSPHHIDSPISGFFSGNEADESDQEEVVSLKRSKTMMHIGSRSRKGSKTKTRSRKNSKTRSRTRTASTLSSQSRASTKSEGSDLSNHSGKSTPKQRKSGKSNSKKHSRKSTGKK